MLTRIRIEVSDEESAAGTQEALDGYESALHTIEAMRFGILAPGLWDWNENDRGDSAVFSNALGREVTDEVIEFDPSIPGYKGRRVVQFKRVDTRWPSESTEGANAGSGFNITHPLPKAA